MFLPLQKLLTVSKLITLTHLGASLLAVFSSTKSEVCMLVCVCLLTVVMTHFHQEREFRRALTLD